MADGFTIDTTELNTLAVDLTAAGTGIAGIVRPIVHKGASNIKNQLRSEMSASRHFAGVASAIDYDMTGAGGRMVFGVGVIEAAIGPSSAPGSPGNLANVAYFGTSRGGGTVPDPRGALEAEYPRFERAVNDALGKIL
jgi:hypothetical protein